MPLGILFWVLYVVSMIVGLWGAYEPATPLWYRRFSGYIVLWILVGMLGWHTFGPVVR
jgi:hypothetical protein